MPNLAAISQGTTEVNRGVDSTPPQSLTVSNRPGEIGLTLPHLGAPEGADSILLYFFAVKE